MKKLFRQSCSCFRDGSYAKSEWKWLDGNKDGVSECYCFNASGYMFANTATPDGYTVNADGQWTENGVVKTKQTGVQSTAGQNRQYGTPDENGCYRTDEYDPEWYAATNGTIDSIHCSREDISKMFGYGSDNLTQEEKYKI